MSRRPASIKSSLVFIGSWLLPLLPAIAVYYYTTSIEHRLAPPRQRTELVETTPKRSSFPVEGITFVTHHKTGTALVGCIVAVIQQQLETNCQHATLQVYVNDYLESHDAAFYLDVAKANAFRRNAEAPPPYLLFKTGSAPKETCFDTAGIAKYVLPALLRSEHVAAMSSGTVCHKACPCHNGVLNCFDLGSCHSTEPLSQLYWVHIIRSPINIVVSAYNYHRIDPPIEAWLVQLNIKDVALWLATIGADNQTLQDTGAYDPKYRKYTYWKFLQEVPEEKGLYMEFIRTAHDMWQMARLYQRMARFEMKKLAVRYEDLEADPMKHLIQPLLEVTQLDRPCLKSQLDSFEGQLNKQCMPRTWSAKRRGVNSHIGSYTKQDKQRQTMLLIRNPYILEQLCRLESLLDYQTLQEYCVN